MNALAIPLRSLQLRVLSGIAGVIDRCIPYHKTYTIICASRHAGVGMKSFSLQRNLKKCCFSFGKLSNFIEIYMELNSLIGSLKPILPLQYNEKAS